jgi:O-antigen/teichoic acid export membrane protein
VAVLAGGTALAQAASVALSPLITRLYRPEDFGTLSVYLSMSSIAAVVGSLRYEVAIPLPADEDEAANLLGVCVGLCVAVSLCVSLLVFFPPAWLANHSSFRAIRAYAYLLPISVLSGSLFQALTYWATRHGAFTSLARTRLKQAFVILAIQVGLGAARLRAAGLLGADAFGRFFGSGSLALVAAREHHVVSRISARGLVDAASRHRRFALFSAPAALVNAIGLNVAPLFLTDAYGAHMAGEFALCQRLMSLPAALFGDAVAQVYLVEASRLSREAPASLDGLLTRTSIRMALLAAAPALAVVLAGPFAFRVVFGAAWTEAGAYARLLSVMLVLQLAVSPVSHTLNILGRQHWQLGWDLGRTGLVAGGLLFAAHNHLSPYAAVALYSSSMALAYMANMILMKVATRRMQVSR